MNRTALGLAAALMTAAASPLILSAPAQAAISPTGDAHAIATAIAGLGANVTGASFVTVGGPNTNGVGDSSLSNFPTDGPTYAVLTTGLATSADDPNTNMPDSASAGDDKSTDLNGGGTQDGAHFRGNTDYDVSVLKVDLNIPATANCLTLDFQFYSEEYFDFVGQAYNDAFIAELDVSNWTTSGSTISAPQNFAFDGSGNVVSVNATGVGTATAANAAGTTYDAATPLLSAATPVTPGAHSVYLSIFDQGDQILDSATFIDNLRVGSVPDPATQCVPGATVNQPPTVDAGNDVSTDEGTPVPLDGTASDADGNTLTYQWSAAPGATVDAGATCTFADPTAIDTTVSCTDDGTWTLTLVADDGVTAASDTATLTVANLAPEITGMTVPLAPVALGTSVSLGATYTDPGSNDTHTAMVEWGDATTSSPAASGGAVSDSHTYGEAGIYTICVTVTDDDGDSDRECAADYVVVYDPNGGFVTGGGWISAAPGSFPASPTASGPGRFGFVSKYHKGATTPVGSTEFQFQSGDLNFHSDSYEWLVVAGSKAIYKGAGTVNGEAGYRFLVSAVDGGQGGVDRFRIKIWEASSSTVIFDNQLGAADDASASNTITQGSIVIHK